jgi:hypothetical protein
LAKGHIILFMHPNLRGPHRHVFEQEPNLSHGHDSSFNDSVSSFVVISGIWKLYRHPNYNTAYDKEFGPGHYRDVSMRGIDVDNDDMSSLRCIRET